MPQMPVRYSTTRGRMLDEMNSSLNPVPGPSHLPQVSSDDGTHIIREQAQEEVTGDSTARLSSKAHRIPVLGEFLA